MYNERVDDDNGNHGKTEEKKNPDIIRFRYKYYRTALGGPKHTRLVHTSQIL